MTTQPKFVPGEAVTVTLGDQATVRVRMVDSVGYLVEGALGTEEDGAARMVHTPWFDYDIPFEQAAETGTRKVIADHATIGLVVTTDGTVADLPRESYTAAEERVVSELKTLGKPFIVVLNSRTPDAPDAQRLRERLAGRYGVPVMAMNVKEMEVDDILGMFEQVLFQFPLREIRIAVPDWLSAWTRGTGWPRMCWRACAPGRRRSRAWAITPPLPGRLPIRPTPRASKTRASTWGRGASGSPCRSRTGCSTACWVRSAARRSAATRIFCA